MRPNLFLLICCWLLAVPAMAQTFFGAEDHQNISLSQNFPNPFNTNTTISFVLPHTADVELTLFNLSGQRIITLVAETRSAGTYAINWNGRNDNGDLLASGVYLYQLCVGNTTEMRKLLLGGVNK